MNRYLTIIFFLALTGIILITQTANQTFGDPDGFYHAKMALLLKDGIIPQQFPWLSQTILADGFADQHFLYHALLIPFVSWEPILGVNIFNTIIIIALAITLWFYFKTTRIKQPLLWLFIIFLGSPGFLYRIQLTKAVQLGLIFLIISVLLIRYKKPATLAAVAFVFTLTYGGFIFLPVLLGFYFIAQILAREKIDYRLYFLPVAAIALALWVHPYDHILSVLYDQVFETGLRQQIPVGQEWYSPNAAAFMGGSGLIIALWFAAIYVWRKRLTSENTETLFLFFVSAVFILLHIKSHRFLEYSIPFTGMFVARVLDSYLSKLDWVWFKKKVKDISFMPIILATVILIVVIGIRTVITYNNINSMPPDRLKNAAMAIANDSNPGDIVLNPAWDEFPALFLYNSKNYYIYGLDPTFMYIKNLQRYWLLHHLARGQANLCPKQFCDHEPIRTVEDVIIHEFNAKYILFGKSNNSWLDTYLANNSNFKLLYTNGQTVVYKRN